MYVCMYVDAIWAGDYKTRKLKEIEILTTCPSLLLKVVKLLREREREREVQWEMINNQ